MQVNCCVVGIAGGSASGKSTFVGALKRHLEEQATSPHVELLSADAFFWADKSQGPKFTSPSTGEEHFNFNHPDALDLQQLLTRITVRSTSADAPHVLVVEGLMLLHIPEIRQLLDVRVFIELEPDVRALRRLLRDAQGGRGTTDHHWIANYYLESARIGHNLFIEPSRVHADLIIRGDSDFSRTAPLLSAAITSILRS